MSFRQSMKNLFLHISPVYRKLDAVQQQLFALADGRKEALETAARLETAADSAAREQSGLAILDGTEYSRYAIPLDYLPSRNLKPRWGYTTGAMPKIKEWFDSYADEYKQMLRYMRTLQVEHIPKTFVSGGGGHLPGPGAAYAPSICSRCMRWSCGTSRRTMLRSVPA